MEKRVYKEKIEETKKEGKIYRRKEKCFLIPRPCPNKGMLGPV